MTEFIVRPDGEGREWRVAAPSPEAAAREAAREAWGGGPPAGARVRVVDEARKVLWVFTREDLEGLREDGEQGEKKWGWWTPYDRPAYVLCDPEGRIVAVGPTLSADEVFCDACNEPVLVRPAPLVYGWAVCPRCFERITGVSPAEAAARDGVVLEELPEAPWERRP